MFELAIQCPKQWKAITNAKQKMAKSNNKFFETALKDLATKLDTKNAQDYVTSYFNITKKICTYTFSINAGPYVSRKSPKNHGTACPVTLHCRKSMLDTLKQHENLIFELVLFSLKH